MHGALRLGKRLSIVATSLGLASMSARPASAGPAENMLGLGARTIALGGAGTALAEDATAIYYNPARLSECENAEVAFGLHHVSYGLKLKDGSAPEARPEGLKNLNRPFIGACLQLPFDLSFGLLLSLGLKEPFSYDHETPNDRPRAILYGQPLETVSIAGGGAFRPIPQLSIGGSVSIALDANILLSADVPLLTNGIGSAHTRADVGFSYNFALGADLALTDTLTLAAAVRTASAVRFHSQAPINANVAGVVVAVPIAMDVVDGFSPFQVAFGASYRPVESLLLVADVTWYQWSKFVQPFLDIRGEGATSLARELQFEPLEPANFRNIVATRLGGELGFLDDTLHLRAGYGFRPTPAPVPTGKANLIDSTTHTLALGVGYAFGGALEAKDHHVECTNAIDVFLRFDAMQRLAYDKMVEPAGTRHIELGGTSTHLGLSYRLGWR